MVAYLVPLFAMLIFGGSFMVATAPLLFLESPWLRMAWLFAAPLVFCVSYVLIAGLLSMVGQRAIVPGKFPRDLKHQVYGPRRLYGLCWTAVYYFAPLYWLCLTVPLLK